MKVRKPGYPVSFAVLREDRFSDQIGPGPGVQDRETDVNTVAETTTVAETLYLRVAREKLLQLAKTPSLLVGTVFGVVLVA
jgi:hypothetical protein